MRNILLVGTFPPPYGGVAIFNSMLYKNMIKKEISLSCYHVNQTSESSECLPLLPVKYFKKLLFTTGRKKILLDSANMFLEYPVDRESFYRGICWVLTKVLKRHKWIKIVHDGSLPIRYEKFTKIQKFFFKKMIRYADSLIVVSDILEKWLREQIGYRKKITLIGSFLPMEDLPQVSIPKNILEFMNRYDKIVLSIGTCEEVYGFEQVIKALRKAKMTLPDISIGLLLVDGGFATTNDIYKRKQEQIKSEADTMLLSEGVPHDVMMEIMRKSDVFIRGFFLESFGISRIEALLCKTPVIATNVGVTDGMAVYEFGDVAAMCKLLISILQEKESIYFQKWISYYQDKADKNLNTILNIIKEIE